MIDLFWHTYFIFIHAPEGCVDDDEFRYTYPIIITLSLIGPCTSLDITLGAIDYLPGWHRSLHPKGLTHVYDLRLTFINVLCVLFHYTQYGILILTISF